MKICTKCGKELPETEFYKDPRRENGLRSICKKCWSIRKKKYRETHKEEISESGKKYYQEHKEQINKRTSKWQKNNKERINNRLRQKREPIKEKINSFKTPCVKCGETRMCTIQFHHIDPSKKLFEINQTNIVKYNDNEIKEELDKCVCLCSNCHTEFHYLYGNKLKMPQDDLKTYLEGDIYEENI